MASSIKEKTRSFRKCLGINNRSSVDALVLPDYKNEYAYELEKGENMDIDDTFSPSLRAGVSLIRNIPTHSIWATADEKKAFCVQNDSLCRLYPDLTTSVIAVGFPKNRVAYVEVNGVVYLTNYFKIGSITNYVFTEFVDINQVYKIKMPAGQDIEYFWSRLYVARDNILWFSDALRFNRLNLIQNFKVFPAEIDLIAATENGMYVSAGGVTYFLEGTNPHKFTLRPVAPYGAYRGQKIIVPGELILKGATTKPVPVWASSEGMCAGLPSGELLNLTMNNYIMPEGHSFACFLKKDKTKKEGYSQLITTVK